MATRTAGRSALAAVVWAIAVTGRPVFAMTSQLPVVVLHVTDHAHVSGRNLKTAERIAARVYEKIGVAVIWVDGDADDATRDGAVHREVVILTAEMTARADAPSGALGQTPHQSKRAYLFYGRILEYAARTHGDVDQVLALALAHELGHMLLPESSHTTTGLMRAVWTGRIVELPDFLSKQAAAIRAMLVDDAERAPADEVIMGLAWKSWSRRSDSNR